MFGVAPQSGQLQPQQMTQPMMKTLSPSEGMQFDMQYQEPVQQQQKQQEQQQQQQQRLQPPVVSVFPTNLPLVDQGTWNPGGNYKANRDAVKYNGIYWMALRNSIGVVPQAGEDWLMLDESGQMMAQFQIQANPPSFSFSSRQVVVVPPTDLRQLTNADRKCVPAIANMVVGRELGKGSYKKVYAICDDLGCVTPPSRVLQVAASHETIAFAEAKKEAALMQKVLSIDIEKKRNPQLVLPIRGVYECKNTNKIFIIQDMADGSMLDRGLAQAKEVFDALKDNKVLVLSLAQIQEAFTLVKELYLRHGLIHGDLKPENFLFRGGHFYLSDFGMSGSFRGPFAADKPRFGWHANRYWQCKKIINTSPRYLIHYNVWQLELSFRADHITFIELPSVRAGFRMFQLFRSVDQLGNSGLSIPKDIRESFDAACPLLQSRLESNVTLANELIAVAAPEADAQFDPQISNLITIQEAVKQAWAARNSKDYENKLPLWIRRLVSQGMYVLEDSELIFRKIPPSSSSSSSSSLTAATNQMRLAGNAHTHTGHRFRPRIKIAARHPSLLSPSF